MTTGRVPLLGPATSLLRAGAIWIEFANWADALAERFGAAEILAGSRVFSSDEVRAELTGRERSGTHVAPAWRTSIPATLAETFLKDMRWLSHGRLRPSPIEGDRYLGTPLVWQHHDLFHRRGRALADSLAVPLVQFVDAPQVWESRKWGVHRPAWGHWVERFGDRPQLLSADLVTVVSEAVGAAVVDLGVDPSRVLVTPCTAEASLVDNSERDRVRDELGLHGRTVIGWIGSFRPFHALGLLVDGFARIADHVGDARLLLVGDGPEMPWVHRRLEELGIVDRAVFTGAVPHDDVGPLLAAMDLAVLPSETLDFHYAPLKLREFLAAGLPVVASDVGDVGDLVRLSRAGWLVPPGDAEALAAAVRQAVEDKACLTAAARRAWEYATSNLGMAIQVDRVVAKLDEIGHGR